NHYKVEPGQDLRYVDDHGRVMTEGNMGRIYTFRSGVFFTYAFLNVFLLVVWFLGLWLLLRYQWSHALGLAVVCWLAMILLIIPMMVARGGNREIGHRLRRINTHRNWMGVYRG